VESLPPGDPSDAEAFRILFGGVVVVCGDLLMGLRPMAPEGDRSTRTWDRIEGSPRDRGGWVRHRNLAVHGHRLSVEVSSDAPADQLAHLLEVVDQVAEIPHAIRAGATVQRVI
jgi:hypothetical protein